MSTLQLIKHYLTQNNIHTNQIGKAYDGLTLDLPSGRFLDIYTYEDTQTIRIIHYPGNNQYINPSINEININLDNPHSLDQIVTFIKNAASYPPPLK